LRFARQLIAALGGRRPGPGLERNRIVIGIVATLMLTRLMTTMLVGVNPTDPLRFVTMMLLFLMIATSR
jgi:hypothetical protein